MFNFNRLDVYGCAISFFKLAVPPDRACPTWISLSQRSATPSRCLDPPNNAEGGGKFDKDERRYFSIARDSALECAAIIDVFEVLGAASTAEVTEARQLLERIVSMLTKLSSNR